MWNRDAELRRRRIEPRLLPVWGSASQRKINREKSIPKVFRREDGMCCGYSERWLINSTMVWRWEWGTRRLYTGCDKVFSGAGGGQAGEEGLKSGAQAQNQEAEPRSISISKLQRPGAEKTGHEMKMEEGPDPRGPGRPHQQTRLCSAGDKTSPKGSFTGQCQGWVCVWEWSLWQYRCLNSKMTLWSTCVHLISIMMTANGK